MPLFDTNELLNCFKRLTAIDKDWFPPQDKYNQFYLRMCHISTDPVMGVRTPAATRVFAMLNPTTLRHKNLSIKALPDVHKNWPLGHG